MHRAALLVLCLAVAHLGCGGDVTVASSGEGGAGASGSTGSTASTTTGSNGSGSGSAATSGSAGTASGGGGAVPGYAACSGPGQCTLVASGCCGVCGMPELSNVVAIHEDKYAEFFDVTCPGPIPPCPGCPTASNPDLFAYCEAGQCVGADVRVHELSACQSDSECVLRAGLECCECGSDGISALRADAVGSLQQLVCVPDEACDDCAPVFPDNAVASCVEGHCRVVYFPIK